MHVHVYRRISSSSANANAFVVISLLSYALPLRPLCSPPPYPRIHQFIFLIRTGLLLIFVGSATPGPPRAFMLISPSFYDFWLLTPLPRNLHSPLSTVYS